MREVFILVLLHKDDKLLSIYRNAKSQDDFIIWKSYQNQVIIIEERLQEAPTYLTVNLNKVRKTYDCN